VSIDFPRIPVPMAAGPVVLSLLAFLVFASQSPAQMVTGKDMPGFEDAFDLSGNNRAKDYSVQEIAVQTGSTSGANVLWPEESAHFTLRFTNNTHHALKVRGRICAVSYRTVVQQGDVWVPHVFKIKDEGAVPIWIDLPADGIQDVLVEPNIPDRLGGYALIADLPSHGRAFAAALVRSIRPDPGRVQFPTYALDMTWDEFMNEGIFTLFEKLGVKGARMGAPYEPPGGTHYAQDTERLDRYMEWAKRHSVTVMLTLGDGDDWTNQPLGRPRPWLSPGNVMLDTKDDRAWLPEYDRDFRQWVRSISERYGWPGGNLNAVELWNEPWEASSISGWGADIPRYRELFTRMAEGVEAARSRSGVQVLIGGTCSTSNARDKLFPDGSDFFLKWLDFISIHYQALAADPSEVPEWVNRKGPYGPVRVWDTESWIANSEDRVAGVIASMRAQGQTRTAGVFDGNVYSSQNLKLGNHVYPIVQAWAPAAAVGASQKFIGQRAFRQLLFENGLPWVFVFDGLPAGAQQESDSDDGTVVVLGDMKKIYDPERTLFRSVGLSAAGILRIQNPSSEFSLYDFYGNRIPPDGPTIEVPLNGFGYFLRSNGSSGSFARLLAALRVAEVKGYDPVEIVAHDLTAALDEHPMLKLTITNVTNHPIDGVLSATLGSISLAQSTRSLTLAANETRETDFQVSGGHRVPSNMYPLRVNFDGGAAGVSEHAEDLHVNLIARRTITVDGDLHDWEGVLPEVLPEGGVGASVTEEAWLPYKSFDKAKTEGAATAYLAYDDDNFYFAAKIADLTPDEGMVRFATRDDDSYFYPALATGRDGDRLAWPAGVRRYSYRKDFDIPSGTSQHDNVQIAFNVLESKPMLSHPPGVMPRFITYWDTDYEFALNPVAAKFGGGTEIWRLQAPGIPRKHFFPRQPKSPIDGGPVNGKLVIHREENTIVLEASIPWSEMPEVRKRIQAGETIKFTCRVNNNKGEAHELGANRSVSKFNSYTFHDDWQTHWSNEIEFGAEK